MDKFEVKFDNKELLNELEAAYTDMISKEYLINSLFENHKLDKDNSVVESIPFKGFLKQFTESKYTYDMIMETVKDLYIPKELQEKGCNWEVIFADEKVIITVFE